jgi:acyl-CoA dehydrogenase
VGRARRCFDYALAYAAERKQFGQPIAKFQGVSFQVADMITEIDAADWLTLAGAWRLDQGLPANREIASPSSMPPRCWRGSPTRRCRSSAAWG